MRLSFLAALRLMLIVTFALIGIAFPQSTQAQVFINEFSSSSNPEWVEIYNAGLIEVLLADWKLKDEKNTIEDLNGILPANGFYVYERNQGWLNNSDGDSISLLNSSGQMVDFITFGHNGDAIKSPSSDKSCGRFPDGSGDWYSNLSWSKGTLNIQHQPTSSPQPTTTLQSTPSLSPQPTSTKAIYKINKSKDGVGDVLTGVKIFVDGTYIHHEDDEILEFYSGHECYSGIQCGFGTHLISLQKEGYSNWEDNRNLSPGINLEVNPDLNKLAVTDSAITPSPTSVKTSTPPPTKKSRPSSTPTKTNVATPGILGIASESATSTTQSNLATGSPVDSEYELPVFAIVLILSGIGLIGFAGFSVFRNMKKSYTSSDEIQNN